MPRGVVQVQSRVRPIAISAHGALAKIGAHSYIAFMVTFPDALPHGAIEEPFPDIFFVTGQMLASFEEFPDVEWSFNRNMIVVRDGAELTLVNSVRLSPQGLAELEALGTVSNLVRIGALHDRDDPFFVDRYGPTFWTMPGIEPEGVDVDRRLTQDELPLAGCTLFSFETTKLPEGVLVLDRAGGVAIACDALQNWSQPDEYFTPETTALMTELGFFQTANFGPLFMLRAAPDAEDYRRLLELPFRHALCGHGEPLRDRANEAYTETFHRAFGT